MREKIRSIVAVIDKIYAIGAIACLIIIVCSCVVQVITRYVINSSLMGTEEISTYGFMWMTMLGIAVCTQKNSHSSIGILNDMLGGRAKTFHKMLIYIAMACGMIVLLVQGVNMMMVAMKQSSPVLRIPMYWIYLCLPTGSIGVLLNLVVHFMDSIADMMHPERSEA